MNSQHLPGKTSGNPVLIFGIEVFAQNGLALVYGGLNKDHLKWFADPEGVIPPPLNWMLNVLQGDALAFYSLGYWYARANGVTLP